MRQHQKIAKLHFHERFEPVFRICKFFLLVSTIDDCVNIIASSKRWTQFSPT